MDPYFAANAVLSIFCKNYMELKKGLPIRPSEMGVLNIITETPGPHTAAVLAELLDVSKPMITAHLASLSEKGYIIRQPSDADRRSFYIVPTEKARTLTAAAKQELHRQLAQLTEEMGQERFDMLVSLVRQANEILSRK